MRLAVLSDIHGNLPALEAVLDDIQARGKPDAYMILGDLVAFCPWPAETLAMLRQLPVALFLQGNTDRYVVTGARPTMPPVDTVGDWKTMPKKLAERDANFRWTVERLSHGDFEFLRDLPTFLDVDVPRYGRLAAVHANAVDDETFLRPSVTDDELRVHFDLDARLMLYGHTHCPMDRTMGRGSARRRIINDGSVGLPLDGDPCPAYAILDFKGSRCHASIHRVVYDREAVVAELKRVDHPAQKWVAGILRKAAG
jgi:predicted phosphodiesterase